LEDKSNKLVLIRKVKMPIKNTSPVFLNSNEGFESITIDVRGVNWTENGQLF